MIVTLGSLYSKPRWTNRQDILRESPITRLDGPRVSGILGESATVFRAKKRSQKLFNFGMILQQLLSE